MAKRGRPVFSQVRQNIVEILYFLGKAYGYEIYKVYKEIYPSVTLRLMYYHLRKGVETGEFKVESVKKVQGDYSWGPEAEKIYYALGERAAAKGDNKVKKYLDKKKN